MIALDTSVIAAITLDEPEAEDFKRALRDEAVLVGWPTLFETRIVLAAKGFANAQTIVAALADAPNVTPLAFERRHYAAAKPPTTDTARAAIPPASTWAIVSPTRQPPSAARPLFKGADFGRTDIVRHPASAVLE